MNHYISMYIDNELSLNEKIEFINFVHNQKEFKDEAVSFIEQEKILGAALNREAPVSVPPLAPKIRFFPSARQSFSMAVAACLLVAMAFLFGKNHSDQIAITPAVNPVKHRFVIHQEGSTMVEITGSFTDWQRIPMRRAGNKGYWEISFDLPPGDHRYSYILNSEVVLPDPTVAAREEDDFGSVNSILSVET